MNRESYLYQARNGFIYQEVCTKKYGYRLQLTLQQVLSIIVDLGYLPIDGDDMSWSQADFNKAYGLSDATQTEVHL